MDKIRKIVFSSFFAALCCVLTMIIKIPSLKGGYVNLGDAAVLASGYFLGGAYGFLAAGIGSALADVFSGYIVYAPATFLIKGIMALIMWWLSKNDEKKYLIAGAIVAEIVMCLGYYIFEGVLYGFSAALLNVLANAVQGICGVIAGLILLTIFKKSKISF